MSSGEFTVFKDMKAHSKGERMYLEIFRLAQKYELDPFQLMTGVVLEVLVGTTFYQLRLDVGKDKFAQFLKEIFNLGDIPCSDEEAKFYAGRISLLDKLFTTVEESE